MSVKVQSRDPLQRNQNPREWKSTMQTISKESIEKWSRNEDRLGYAVDQLGIEGEENEENLERLMGELRAD